MRPFREPRQVSGAILIDVLIIFLGLLHSASYALEPALQTPQEYKGIDGNSAHKNHEALKFHYELDVYALYVPVIEWDPVEPCGGCTRVSPHVLPDDP